MASVDEPSEREPRASVILRAVTVVAGRGMIGDLRVRNLSAHGACLDHEDALKPGDRLAIDMGQVTGLTATVMWANARQAGVQFDQQVDIEQARRPRNATPAVRTGWVADLRSPY